MQWVSILTFASRKVWKNTCKFGSGDGPLVQPFQDLPHGNFITVFAHSEDRVFWTLEIPIHYIALFFGSYVGIRNFDVVDITCTSEFYFSGWCEQKRPEIIQKFQFSLLLNLESRENHHLCSPTFLVLVAFLIYITWSIYVFVCTNKPFDVLETAPSLSLLQVSCLDSFARTGMRYKPPRKALKVENETRNEATLCGSPEGLEGHCWGQQAKMRIFLIFTDRKFWDWKTFPSLLATFHRKVWTYCWILDVEE